MLKERYDIQVSFCNKYSLFYPKLQYNSNFNLIKYIPVFNSIFNTFVKHLKDEEVLKTQYQFCDMLKPY